MDVNTTYEPFAEEPEYIRANADFLATLDLDRVRTVVDLACGTGLLAGLLLDRKPELRVWGVDLSAESLAIARRRFAEAGRLAAGPDDMAAAGRDGRGAAWFEEGSADDLAFADASFDLATMGNAIHLMPDKDRFLAEVGRVLAPGGRFAFNSVFFVGTFADGTEAVYTEWLKQAVTVLAEMNEARRRAGEPPIPRRRGTAGHAFDKGWLAPEAWAAKLAAAGFEIERNDKRTVAITRRGLELVGAYGGLAEVLMSGYPVEIASACLQEGARRAFDALGIAEVPRHWLEITAVKPA